MSTSLQRQLAALAVPSSALLVPERRIASILFPIKKASGYSRDTFHAIGLEGLHELIGINPHLFEKYESSKLFDDISMEFERAVEDSVTNDVLDKEINDFLISLSPYLMLKSSLKCLEWLVNRFHIQKFNISSLLECIMPYYDTKSFSMIIQVLDIERFKNENKQWHWLISNVQTALPLSKALLYSNSNPKFIIWLFRTFLKHIQVHESHTSNLQSYISFLTSTVVGILSSILYEIPKRHEKNQRSFYKSKGVIHCLWSQIESFLTQVVSEIPLLSHNEEIQSMVYVIVSLLGLVGSQKSELNEGNESLIGKTMAYILKNHSRALTTQVYLLLNLLTPHTNKVFKLPGSKLLPILGEIMSVGQNWDLFNISSKILLDNVTSRKSGLTFSKIWSTVEGFEINPTQRSHLLKNIYERLRNSKSYYTKKWAKGFLSRFERQYPIEFGLICQSDPQFASDLVHFKKGENLSLLAQHPDSTVRKNAVKKLLKRFTLKVAKKTESGKLGITEKRKGKAIIPKLKGILPDKNSTAQAILPRFLDDDSDIVMIVLKTKIDVLNTLYTSSTLGDTLIQVVAKRPSVRCTKLALKHLCTIALDSARFLKSLTSKILTVLIPFLFPTKEGVPVKLAITILKSKFASEHKFLKQYSSVEKKGLTHVQLCSFSYEALMKSSKLSLTQAEDNLLCKMLSLLTLTAPSDVEKIIKVAEAIDCIPTGNYPVTSINFSKCIQVAQKKKTLSLDFIFTTVLKLNLQNKTALLAKVFKFVWKISERIEKKNLCVQFLSDFVKSSFSSPEAQMDFWCTMIRTSKGSTPEEEFFLLRVLQFLASCIEHNPLSLKNYLSKANLSKDKIGTISTESIHGSEKTAAVAEYLFEILLSHTLYHDSHRIRSWALNCLSVLSDDATTDTTAAAFIMAITTHRDEILAVKEQTVVVISKILQTKQFVSIRDRFVNTIVDETTEQSIAVGLLKLCQLVSSQIFARFLTTANDLLAKRPESNILLAVLDCYDVSVDSSLEIVKAALKHKATYLKILSKLTRDVVESFDINWQNTILRIMIETLLTCEIPEIKIGIQRCVRKWTLEASIISAELDKCIAMEKFEGTLSTTSNLRKNKDGALRGSNSNIRKLVEGSDWGTRTEVVLELIQSKKRLIQKTKLIRPLFKLLKICIAMEEQSPVEYLKQLILTSLTLCCYDDFKSKMTNNDWIYFNVDTVIDCLRCSRNPQTHHHALILLNYAAQLYPEQVLHGVMSLFTFMGNSILRQDDTYSTQLIQQTVTTIIPTFVNTSTVRKYLISRVSAGIYFAFASAVQDIPVHRRLPVLKSLVETLNPAESMWQLCVIIIDKALTRDKKRSQLTADMELALDIVEKFEPMVALSTMEKIYIYLLDLPIYDRPNDEEFKIKRLTQSAASKAVVDLTRKESLRDVEILIYYTLELGMKICSKFADLDFEDKKLSYDILLEKCLSYSRLVSNIHDDKIFRLITQRNLEVIERINAALDPNDLVRTVIAILIREDLSVKKKMLDMLNHRITHKLDWFGNLKILLELVNPLVEFSNCEPESDDVITVIQTAFISLKLISRHLASTYPDQFVPVFDLTFHHTTHSNRLLRASAFTCLGELFCLKALILPNLSSVCSSILKAFKASAKLNTQGMQKREVQDGEDLVENGTQETKHEEDMSISVANLLCISALTCLTKLSDQLGNFIGAKFLQKSLVAVFQVSGIFGIGEKAGNRKKTFDQRLKALLKSVGTKIPLRNSLPSIQKIFKDTISLVDFKHTNSIILLVEMLKETLGNTPKTDFTNLFPAICEAFMVDFLSYRDHVSELHRNNMTSREVTHDELVQVEDAILDCLTNGIVLKVSEGVFRSFYHKIFDWAGENTERLITFYRFSAVAAEKLKSLFVTFAGYVINKGVETLHVDVRLTQAILKYFYHIFSNDREGFITIDRFNSLVKPLVDLIESDYTINDEISIKDINNTLVQLAVATNDLNRWQYLIELISLKSEHENKKVRLFVISILGAAATELGKDFLPLLPPAVPFLVELLNDADENVETETKKMLITLEDMVGEQLQPYFAA